MKNFKLSIDLLPKGAWGHDLSTTLPKKDWDKLRTFCYKKAHHKCEICGCSDADLHAHEVWDFDIINRTQTLTDIIALCPACHGVKHYRNSKRIGYGEQSKAHFMRVNRCSVLDFAGHVLEAEMIFRKCNNVLRWNMIVELDKFGGEGIKFKQRKIPLIDNPYENIDWSDIDYKETVYFKTEEFAPAGEDNEIIFCPFPPKVKEITVDNYAGIITVESDYTNKIEWLCNEEIKKTKYNVAGKFRTTLSVENMNCKAIHFKLTGSGGETTSRAFKLVNKL